MKQHSLDLAALVFGVAFALAGAVILLVESTNVDVGPLWGFAVVSIAVGVVTLLVTLVRSRHEPVAVAQSVEAPLEPDPAVSVASGEPADDLADG
jgi:hypothetical protein